MAEAWLELPNYSASLENLLVAQMRAGDLDDAIKTVILWGEIRGRDPDSVALLEQAFDAGVHSRTMLSMRINPSFDFVREDSRFRALLEKTGLG